MLNIGGSKGQDVPCYYAMEIMETTNTKQVIHDAALRALNDMNQLSIKPPQLIINSFPDLADIALDAIEPYGHKRKMFVYCENIKYVGETNPHCCIPNGKGILYAGCNSLDGHAVVLSGTFKKGLLHGVCNIYVCNIYVVRLDMHKVVRHISISGEFKDGFPHKNIKCYTLYGDQIQEVIVDNEIEQDSYATPYITNDKGRFRITTPLDHSNKGHPVP